MLFSAPFLVCTLVFVSAWLIYDLVERLGELIQLGAGPSTVLQYYKIQIPSILPLVIPVSVLLAGISCATSLVRNGEFVAMLCGGLSPARIAFPAVVIGALAGGCQMVLECTVAPVANREREEFLEELRAQAKNRERRSGLRIRSSVYYNQKKNRIWYLRRAEVATATLNDVEILQMDLQGRDVWKIFARSMVYEEGSWHLRNAVRVNYPISQDELPQKTDISGQSLPELTETFAQVASGVFPPDVMSFREISTFLDENPGLSHARVSPYVGTQVRQMIAWIPAFGSVLIAWGLCARSTKRSGLVGVGMPVTAYVIYVLCDQFFFALGKSGRFDPYICVSIPHCFWLIVGFALFLRRSRILDA